MKIYNTETRKKENFVPINEEEVKIYTCGPTVYNFAHIGNLRTYVFEDILVKVFKYLGYDVNRVMNITDVGHLESDADEGEDKMMKAAKRENKNPLEIARYYEDKFFEDMKELNIERPNTVCRATEEIDTMIELVKKLEEKGYTYVADGNVYFDISKFEKYAEFAGLEIGAENYSRVEIDENKRNQEDFVLWFTNSKFENQILKWDSPWGVGYPGWHLECSAMSIKYLGEKLDIHCGGVDHIKVHHTNEIAQSEAAIGHKWVNYWMHGEFLNDETGKMSKSKGEFLTLEVLKNNGVNPLVYRFYLLESRYRKQLVFSYDNMKKAEQTLGKLREKIDLIEKDGDIEQDNIKAYVERFKDEIADDLNTANALTVLYDVLKDDTLSGNSKIELIKDFDRVLSLDLIVEKELPEGAKGLIDARIEARANKDFAKSDELRDALLELGVAVKDTREGMKWIVK
ncbi:MAG: cysteine--tRNA ligase [Clostridia bacterium]|nr:cysteine--tRNA ligase [Clostridia bacterium]